MRRFISTSHKGLTNYVSKQLIPYTAPFLQLSLQRYIDAQGSKSPLKINIIDLGASNGHSSLQLISTVLQQLEMRLPQTTKREYLVLHEDQLTNNYNLLFRTLHSPRSYLHHNSNVYCGAVAENFYKRLVPSASIDIFLSYVALHWLSEAPTRLPRSSIDISSASCDDDLQAKWKAAAHEDLVQFLRLRAEELADHGIMCVAFAGDNGNSTVKALLAAVETALEHVVLMELLSLASLSAICLPTYSRTVDEVVAAAAQIPHLKVHEVEAISLDTSAPSADSLAEYFLEISMPYIVAGMTEYERKNRYFRKALKDCLVIEFSKPLGHDPNCDPLYRAMTVDFIYASFTREQRIPKEDGVGQHEY